MTLSYTLLAGNNMNPNRWDRLKNIIALKNPELKAGLERSIKFNLDSLETITNWGSQCGEGTKEGNKQKLEELLKMLTDASIQ